MSDEHDPYKGDDRREIHYVADRPTERGITLNNIITGMILLVAGWAGNNIDEMNEKFNRIDKQSALNTRAISVVIDEHEELGDDIDRLKNIVTRAHPELK